MKKSLFSIIILLFISFISLYSQLEITSKSEEVKMLNTSEKGKNKETNNVNYTGNNHALDAEKYKGMHMLIGQSGDHIQNMWGKPIRIDPSSYDYVWWIYKQNENSYIQVGVLENKVVSLFAIGSDVNLDPFYIGQPYDQITKNIELQTTHNINVKDNSYRFELSEEEKLARPLVQFGEVWAQLYIDQFTKKLSSIRYMDNETLVKQRPYELVYRGELISARELSSEEWSAVEKGNSEQILDITNMIRKRYEIKQVVWHEETSKVAFLHSKDMKENDYFSHDSPTKGGLADRLQEGEIKYQLAGENIAAKYVDGIAAVEGWLNSKGHRETLLNNEFTHLGVGVYEKYYTQNFINTWEFEFEKN
ncbi:CAP domain-containing protein [Bacillus suaedaesalsae]|uniref:CAP domain-containing protein n=1 Tax=Bacillus suaedaesalsae TaxID=2810349 RepID=A0ABS2DJK1_9BACI|nr:CAP domain-containing protein [Bacillus suaedaesalsae]MBM6618582.1 CAP domain-containing protein [Bacillus suaedaesalsae]